MPAVARVGVDTVGGGLITGPGATSVLVNGSPASIVGDAIASHGSGPHAAATITGGSATVFAEGTAIARVGDPASCGDTVDTGSPDVNAGG